MARVHSSSNAAHALTRAVDVAAGPPRSECTMSECSTGAAHGAAPLHFGKGVSGSRSSRRRDSHEDRPHSPHMRRAPSKLRKPQLGASAMHLQPTEEGPTEPSIRCHNGVDVHCPAPRPYGGRMPIEKRKGAERSPCAARVADPGISSGVEHRSHMRNAPHPSSISDPNGVTPASIPHSLRIPSFLPSSRSPGASRGC